MADMATASESEINDNTLLELSTLATSEEGIQNNAKDQTHKAHEDQSKKPSEDVQLTISNNVTQDAISNVVLSEASKTDGGELVFTVVAVDSNLTELLTTSGIHPESIPKEVQLSLAEPVSGSDPIVATSEVATSEQHSDINQLALIAASIEQNTDATKEVADKQNASLPVVTMEQSSKRKNSQDASGNTKTVKGRILCTVCDQDFSDLPSMRRHRLIHSGEKPFQCDFCEKSFRRKDNLREHRNIHTQEHVYKCERCGKTFPRKYTHKVHMSRFCMKAGEVAVECEDGTWSITCDKGKNGKQNMAGKTSDPCPMCLKTFRDASTLKRHLLTHSDERPYKCQECEKAFRRKDHLQEHVIVHNLVRPFTCQTCGKSFSRKNGLKTHMIRTTHLLGFDDIILPSKSVSSAEVDVQVVEQVLAGDQLVTTTNEVFPADSQENFNQAASDKDMPEADPQCEGREEASVSLEFSEVQTSSMETVVLDEKCAEPIQAENPEEVQADSSSTDVETMGGDPAKLLPLIPRLFACPACGLCFPNKHQLWEHYQEHVAENMLACQYCFDFREFRFDSAEILEEHQKTCEGSQSETAMRGDGEQPVATVGTPTETSPDCALQDEKGPSQNETEQGCDSRKRKKTMKSPTVLRLDQTCPICNKVFRDNTALKRHSLVHSGERPHSCMHCDKKFRRRDHLKAHETAYHSGKTAHECKTCGVVFNTRYALTVHSKTCKKQMASPPPENPVSEEAKITGNPESKSCPICHKTFKDPSTQRRHFRIHSDERPFNCTMCSKSFRRKDNLKEHLLCHSEEKPFACTDCGKSLSRRSSLTNHMNVCPARKGVGETSLSTEMQFTEEAVAPEISTSSDPQDISEANIDFSSVAIVSSSDVTPTNMTSSDVTSSEVAPEAIEEEAERGEEDASGGGNSFPCEECGKVFRAKWTLKFHQRIHTGEKPYTCTTCERQFRQPSHLKIHERTHTGERPFPCNICGRAFIDSSTLKRHERLHKDAADPNAVIDEQHDVINEQEYVISNQHEVIDHSNQAIDGNDASIVQQAVEVTIPEGLDSESAIQLLVTTANELANSAEPISTNVVSEMSHSGEEIEARLDESNLGQILRECIRNQEIAATEKMDTLEALNWQQNQPAETVEQLIYIQTDEPAPTE